MSIRRPLLAALALASVLASTPFALAQDTRTVTTSFGDVEVPVNPQRVITTHYIATQPLLDLGLVPVGQGAITAANVPDDYWAQIENVPVVATPAGEVNLEQAAALEPDLIFAINTMDPAQVDELRKLAPVVLVGISGPDRAKWQSRVAQIAEATNRTAELKTVEEAFAARQADIKARTGDMAAAHPIAVWVAWDFGEPALYPSNTMSGRILEPAGAVYAQSVEALKTEDGSDVYLSNETLGDALADAQILFYGTALNGDPIETTTQTRDLGTYKALSATAAGYEFPIGKLTIAGYGDANAILTYYEKALASLH